jgi:hypothetical protein
MKGKKSPQFHQRLYADGTIDSICLSCFLTAARAENKVGLRELEAAHERWKGEVFEEPIPEPLTLPPRLDREDALLTRRTSRSRFLAVPVTRRGDVFVGRTRPGRSLVERPRSSPVFRRSRTGDGMSDLRPHPTKWGNSRALLQSQVGRGCRRPTGDGVGIPAPL